MVNGQRKVIPTFVKARNSLIIIERDGLRTDRFVLLPTEHSACISAAQKKGKSIAPLYLCRVRMERMLLFLMW